MIHDSVQDLKSHLQPGLRLLGLDVGAKTIGMAISDGGLAVALAESAIASGLGVDLPDVELGSRIDAALFGEAGARAVVSVAPADLGALEALALECGLPATRLGTVGGERLRIGSAVDVSLAEAAEQHGSGLERALLA